MTKINSKTIKGLEVGEWSTGRFYFMIAMHIPTESSSMSGWHMEIRIPNVMQVRWYQKGYRKVWKAAC